MSDDVNMDEIKADLLSRYARKPVQSVLTIDGIGSAPTDLEDEDGDLVCAAVEFDLRASLVPVRVSIYEGVGREDALRLLEKIQTFLQSDDSPFDLWSRPPPSPAEDIDDSEGVVFP